MKQADIQSFLIDFFTSRQASIVEKSDGILTVKLTEQLDEQLMNRPFYWQYVKKLGKVGETMSVTFITDEEKRDQQKGEWIHFGSPRLDQIFHIIQREGAYTVLYEDCQSNSTTKTPLHPWLICNIRVKYRGFLSKDELVSVGIRLIDGTMRFQMMDEIEHKNFASSVPNFCFTLPTIISTERAVERVTEELQQRIKQKSTHFVNKSHRLYEREMNMLKKLIIDDEKDDAEHQRAKVQIFERLYPQVDLEWINLGYFYVSEQMSKELIS
ncbi:MULTISPECIES: YqhG family protein [Allobacillus]|uniref:Uncharacterized protein n=1 Tax=Allobacillus salarius TaxID=1955272 RepID=A0A556PTG3_9BACI|nr:YqhG family protein [Allobacillus salarius]TSJ67684.1 hypothetical protein FPQ13_01030 [Allobacillus salarius]